MLQLVNLRCEQRVNPLGIDAARPRLSWNLVAPSPDTRDIFQTACRVLAASSAEALARDHGDLWDSGRVDGETCLFVRYAGAALASSQEVHWKVMVWDQSGQPSAWSAPATWTMGLLADSDWQARWIGLARTNPDDALHDHRTRLAARHLRREFHVRAPLRRALVHFCGLGLSELTVNGLPASDALLSPGLAEYPKRAFYVTHDLTALLAQGPNALGVLLGNGRYFHPRRERNRLEVDVESEDVNYPALLLRLELAYADGTTETLVSDGSWRVTDAGPIRANNEYDGEHYDATRELPGWDRPGYDDSAWSPADLLPAPTARLVADPLDPIRRTETLKPVRELAPAPGLRVFDLGQDFSGWCRLRVRGPRETVVKLHYVEHLHADGTPDVATLRSALQTDTYVLRGGGPEAYEPRFAIHGFRHLAVSATPALPADLSLEGVVVHDDLRPVGDLECADALVNRLLRNMRWCLRGNYRSIPIDSNARDERQGWTGDRNVVAESESWFFDVHRLYRKFVEDMRSTQNEQGNVSGVAPAYWPVYTNNTTWAGAIVTFTDMLHRQYGDLDVVRDLYPALRRWMDYMAGLMENDILAVDLFGDWVVPPERSTLIHTADPRRSTPCEIIATAWFRHQAGIMRRFADLLGETADSARFADLAERLRRSLHARLFDPAGGAYANNSATANLLALAFGDTPPDRVPALLENIVDRVYTPEGPVNPCGMVGLKTMLRTLSRFGRADVAHAVATARLYPSWGYTVERGATAVWELWNGDIADPGMRAMSQAMNIGDFPLWAFENMAGLRSVADEPGFKRVVLAPSPVGEMPWLRCAYASPYGRIESRWRVENGTFAWTFRVPANTRATVRFPWHHAADITLDGQPLPATAALRDDRVEISLGNGEYTALIRNFVAPGARPRAAKPVIDPQDVTLAAGERALVTLSTSTPGAALHYTLDGSSPTESSPRYTAPFSVDRWTSIRARAFAPGLEPSARALSIVDFAAPANGLRYAYYEGDFNNRLPDFATLKPDAEGHCHGCDPHDVNRRPEYFCVVFTGHLDVPVAGDYTLFTRSHNGCRLYIDGVRVIDNDNTSQWRDRMVRLPLAAGRRALRIEYLQHHHDFGFFLSWSGPGIPFQKVPLSRLFPS